MKNRRQLTQEEAEAEAEVSASAGHAEATGSALWIQYSYPDTKNAAVLQTADSREEAKDDDDLFPGCPWYRYDIAPTGPKGGDGTLINECGPHYFGVPEPQQA